MSRQSRGRNIANLLSLGGQQITSIIGVSNFNDEDEEGYQRQLVMATEKGVVKKTKLSAYGNPRSSGVIAIKLDDDDQLIGVAQTCGTDNIILGTVNGMAIRFNEKDVRSMGRTARGVRGINLRKGDKVVGMVIARDEKSSLLTICEKGYGKRTLVENYRCQTRGGVGLKNIRASERNGKVVGLKGVNSDDDIMLVTAKGIVIRTGLTQIRSIGRNTQGVRLIKLKQGDKLVTVEKISVEEVD
jgi:DNA gyrase subunit A